MIIGISGKIGSGKDTVGGIIEALISYKYNKDNSFFKDYDENTFVLARLRNQNLIEDDDKHKCYANNPEKWEIKKFADKLKDIVCLLLGCSRELLEDREYKELELPNEWNFYTPKGRVDGKSIENNILFSTPQEALDYAVKWTDYSQEAVKHFMTPRLMLQLLGTEAGRNIIHPNIWVNSLFSDYKESPPHKDWICNWIVTDTRFPNEADSIKNRNGILIRVNRGKSNPNSHLSETALDNYENWDYIIDNNGTIQDLINEVKDILIKENLL